MITAATLRRIAAMPAEAMVEALLFLAEQQEEQDAKRAVTAARQERYRQRNKDVTETQQRRDKDGAVTSLARVEDNTLPSLTSGKEVSKNLPLSPSKTLSSDPNGFEEFWNVYPKRHKNLDRKAAVKAFNAALKRTDLQTLVDAARAYATDCKADNKIGTEFVKQARSWLNGDCWTEWQPMPQEQALLLNGRTYVKYGTDAGDAWQAHYKALGKIAPRDFKGGYWFPSEYPSEGATQ